MIVFLKIVVSFILLKMKIFIQLAVFLIMLNATEHAWSQAAFTGLYQDAPVTIAEGGILYVGGEYQTNAITFNGGSIYVEQDIKNLNPSTVGLPNPVGETILNGNQDQKIIGNWNFNILSLDKPAGNVMLEHDITIDSLVSFVQGNLYIDNYTVDLKNKGALYNETNDNRIYAVDGVVTTTRNLQFLTKTTDIAGLGLFIESPLQTFGTTTISRGHTVFPEAGAGSIARYFDITTTNTLPVDNIVLRYFDTDNPSNETLLQLYSFKSSRPVWFPRGGVVDELLDTIASPYYRNLGTERITLAPASDNATCAPSDPNYVEAIYLSSSYAFVEDTVVFVNFSFSKNTTAAMSYIWNFGDGTSADREDTSHIYSEAGFYTTTLQVSNGFCSDLRKKDDTIAVRPPTRDLDKSYGQILSSFSYYPNPCSSVVTVDAELTDVFPSSISIFDMLGRKHLQSDYAEQNVVTDIPLQQLTPGMYLLEFQSMGKIYTYKLIKD